MNERVFQRAKHVAQSGGCQISLMGLAAQLASRPVTIGAPNEPTRIGLPKLMAAGASQAWQLGLAQWVMPLQPCRQHSLYAEVDAKVDCATKRQANSTAMRANHWRMGKTIRVPQALCGRIDLRQ